MPKLIEGEEMEETRASEGRWGNGLAGWNIDDKNEWMKEWIKELNENNQKEENWNSFTFSFALIRSIDFWINWLTYFNSILI